MLILPDGPLSLLLGIAQPTPETDLLARWIGAALLAIGVVSGMARDDQGGAARRGVVVAAVIYDIVAVVLFVYAAVSLGLGGPALWPAALLHTVLAVWGLLCLRPEAME